MTVSKKNIWDVDPVYISELFNTVPETWSRIKSNPSKFRSHDEEVQHALGIKVQPSKNPWIGPLVGTLLTSGLMVYLYKKYVSNKRILPENGSSKSQIQILQTNPEREEKLDKYQSSVLSIAKSFDDNITNILSTLQKYNETLQEYTTLNQQFKTEYASKTGTITRNKKALSQIINSRKYARHELFIIQNKMWNLWERIMSKYTEWMEIQSDPIFQYLPNKIGDLEHESNSETKLTKSFKDLYVQFKEWVKKVVEWEKDYLDNSKQSTVSKQQILNKNIRLKQELDQPEQKSDQFEQKLGLFLGNFEPLSILECKLLEEKKQEETKARLELEEKEKENRQQRENKKSVKNQSSKERQRQKEIYKLEKAKHEETTQKRHKERRELKENRTKMKWDGDEKDEKDENYDVCKSAEKFKEYVNSKVTEEIPGWGKLPHEIDKVNKYNYEYVFALVPPDKTETFFKIEEYNTLRSNVTNWNVGISRKTFLSRLDQEYGIAKKLSQQHIYQYVYVFVTYCSFRSQLPYDVGSEGKLLKSYGLDGRSTTTLFGKANPFRPTNFHEDMKKLFFGDLSTLLEEPEVTTVPDRDTVINSMRFICHRFKQLSEILLKESSVLLSNWSRVNQFCKAHSLNKISEDEYATRGAINRLFTNKLDTYENLKRMNDDIRDKMSLLLTEIRRGYIYAEYTVVILRHLYKMILEEYRYRYKSTGDQEEQSRRLKEFDGLKEDTFKSEPCVGIKLYSSVQK